MKAFLLAAGLGTRLRPITNEIPKCLVPVCGKPMLQWWIELFEQHHISEVLINLHHLSDQVVAFIKNNKTSIKFTFVYEKFLLGSAGTLFKNIDFIKENENFFICYADNLTNYNLNDMLNYHLLKRSSFTMALFSSNNPKACGIATLNKKGVVIHFEEKPEKPESNLANAGIYLANKSVLNKFRNFNFKDIGYELLPKIIGKMYGWKSDDYLIDIGTLENLQRAEEEWSVINNL